jgi:hypothetical protein
MGNLARHLSIFERAAMHLNRVFIIVAALIVLGGAAAFAAQTPAGALRSVMRATATPPSNDPLAAGWLCRAQRDALGAASFSQLWAENRAAPRSTMGRCVTFMAKASAQGKASQVERSILAAQEACKRMRGNHPAAFRKQFGANTSRSNALGKCVRALTR